ncbi:MAG: agmatinase [Armatimonadota bacterium]|nr:agmatinase [Armatimonadota bacterium]
MPFLAARPHRAPAAVVLGAPYDRTATHRRGARLAPSAIRWASDGIETYSPVQHGDLDDLALADAGDLDLSTLAPAAMVERVRDAVAATTGLPCLLGGEHTVTVGAVSALADRHPGLSLVALDAHLDLRDDYGGERWSHAGTLRRIGDRLGLDRIVVLGARSGTRDEWGVASSLRYCGRTGALPTEVWRTLRDRPLYLSVDVDGFDPSLAPGTGNPEPLGLTVDDFITVLSVMREGRVVGCDVVEVCPPFDPSGQTAMLAAWLVREMLLAFAR